MPSSKSLTNRYLVLAALADGTSRLRRPLVSRDAELMVGALRALGPCGTAGHDRGGGRGDGGAGHRHTPVGTASAARGRVVAAGSTTVVRSSTSNVATSTSIEPAMWAAPRPTGTPVKYCV